jgi:hypothetical protein
MGCFGMGDYRKSDIMEMIGDNAISALRIPSDYHVLAYTTD